MTLDAILAGLGLRRPRPRYYAEHDTDRIIRETFFPDFDRKGIMVEVGGGTPEFLSMSKHFKDSGWRTIVVEPNPAFVDQHRKMGNEVYQYACSFEDRSGVPFTVVSQQVEAYGGIVTDHSFSSLEIKPGFAAHLPANATRKELSVKDAATLAAVDLLSVDVEGWELEVLRGFDTNRIECPVIVLENFNHEPSYADYMRGIGYDLARKIEYNYVFTRGGSAGG